MPDLLLELFSEDIPARMQARAAEDLRRLATDALVEAGLAYEAAAAFATPRRIALSVTGLPKATRATREERRGPRTDAPAAALEGFLRSTGLTRERLEARPEKKGEAWFAVIERPGRPAAEVIAGLLPAVLRALPWPRSMRWGSGDLAWVRPLRSILCILSDEAGAEIVRFGLDGIQSGGETAGHRFMAPSPFAPGGFEDYERRLRAAKVVLDPAERAERILEEARGLAFASGLELVEDDGLLAEVAGLVEWPVPLLGAIEERFLGLPPEVLRTSMKTHQKFFSVRDPKTGRIGHFVTVANIETADQGETILAGNLRVLAARLSDAVFFWENDLRVAERDGLAAFNGKLKAVTFHSKLGSQFARVERISALARELAPRVGADPAAAARAGLLCKADLASEMVGEFPELQGRMGARYALAADEAAEVAEAIREHYAPLGPSDAVPTAPVAAAVALADKLDTLTGFWAIDEKPTGSKDPFALRRAALGVVRILLEREIRLPLLEATLDPVRRARAAMAALAPAGADGPPDLSDAAVERECALIVAKDLLAFLAERLKVHLRGEGVRHDVIDACFRLGGQDDLVLLVNRVRALQFFLGAEDGANLLAGYRRAANIVAKETEKDGEDYFQPPEPEFADQEEETALFAALDRAEHEIAVALKAEDFAAAMAAMARLRAPIDAFFGKVTVNAEVPVLRRNRLRLLARVKAAMERVAAFSAIEG